MADAQRPRPAPENEVAPAETPTLASLMTLLVGVAVRRGALFRARRVPADRARGAARLRAGAVRRSPAPAQARTGVLGDRRGARRARRHRAPSARSSGCRSPSSRRDLPRYERRSATRSAGCREGASAACRTRMRHLGREIERATQDAAGPGPDADAGAGRAAEPQQPLPVEVRQPDPTPLELAQRFVAPLLQPLAMPASSSWC